MKASSRSVIARHASIRKENNLESSGSTYLDSVISSLSPGDSEKRSSLQSESATKPRKTKMQKIQELLDENRRLKKSAWQMSQELTAKELQLKALNARQSQFASGEGTKEGPAQAKHMEALRALSAVTKTQQEILAGHHERYEELSREYEESQQQTRQLKKDLSVKKKEVTMLEKEIDSNLLEITGLRKELAQALQTGEKTEADHRSERRNSLDVARELALIKTRQNEAPDAEEMNARESTIESQRVELEQRKERIRQLEQDLELTQSQVKTYEQERDATVAEMERCYGALKKEIEEKSTLLEGAEREKAQIESDTTEALRALEQRCDQLNVELLDAQDEMSMLRRENDASSFASLKSDAMQQDFEEERQRLKSTLVSMETELTVLKNRHKDMLLEHTTANQALEEENANLRIQYEEFRSMVREADIRNQALSEESELQKIQNETLLDISRDLQLKLRQREEGKDHDAVGAGVVVIPDPGEAQSGQNGERANGASREPGLALSTSQCSFVMEDGQGNIDIDLENLNGDSNSSFFSDEAAVDSRASPSFSQGVSTGRDALPLITKKESSSSSDQEDRQAEPTVPTAAGPAAGQQALLLAAAAGRKMQKTQSEKTANTPWRLRKRGQNRPNSPLPPISGSPGPSSSLSGVDKPIESLERENDEQKKLIKKLKSEIVRLNAFYRDAAYINRKKVETLSQENAAYEIKIVVLEKMLEKLGGGATELHSQSVECGGSDNTSMAKETLDDSISAVSREPGQEEDMPQRDWSSPPKFLDRIKDLEGQVQSLEKEKKDAEAKMKAVESDLDSYQRTSKKAALDSLFEIERLKRENAEKDRQLASLQEERLEAVADEGNYPDIYTRDMDREAIGEDED